MPKTLASGILTVSTKTSILFTIEADAIAYTDQANGYKAEFFCTKIKSFTSNFKCEPDDKPAEPTEPVEPVFAQLNNGTLLHGTGVEVHCIPASRLAQTSVQFNVYLKA